MLKPGGPEDNHRIGEKLAQVLGPRSALGKKTLAGLADLWRARPDRSRALADWRQAMSGEVQEPSDGQLEPGAPLSSDEEHLLKQAYFVMVAETVAGVFLGGLELGKPGPAGPFPFREWGLENPGNEELPEWYAQGRDWPLTVAELAGAIGPLLAGGQAQGDCFRPLYENLFSRRHRHELGEHYTPGWLAAHVLDTIGYLGQEGKIIDPTCGSGVFLLEALRRLQARRAGPQEMLEAVTGLDINPLAVLAARVNYLMQAGLRPARGETIKIPVYRMDSILGPAEGLWQQPAPEVRYNSYQFVAGNPPWVNWESLSPAYRRATLEHWQNYGLFSHQGMDTILGKGKKDFSSLMTLACADRFLAPGGRLAFLVTQSLFKSGGAAEGFRHFRLPGGAGLKVLRAEDLSEIKPFAGAANRTAILYLQRDAETRYPVEYTFWKSVAFNRGKAQYMALELAAIPVDRRQPNSPWLTCRRDTLPAVQKVLGQSDYRAREGVNTGGANGILWVEVLDRPQPGLVKIRNQSESSRRELQQREAIIEEGLLYPLLKGKDLDRWRAVPSSHIILTQDPVRRRGLALSAMQRDYPRTLSYLLAYESELKARAAYRRYFKGSDPFYTIFDVGTYSLAPYKVAWHRFGKDMKAAVLEAGGKPMLCQETHTFVACDNAEEAWYLAGLLNSLPVEYALASYSMVGGKSFAGPNVFRYLHFLRYTGSPQQRVIETLARKVAAGELPQSILDQEAARLYGIEAEELALLEEAYREIKP